MTARTAISLGLGAVVVGAFLIFGCDRSQAQSGESATPAPPITAPAKPAGEPAPAAPRVPAALPPDVAFGRFIALIRGHLLTGEELVSRRDWVDAHPHFEFPREEIYGVIREQLPTYKTPSFDRALNTLARAVQARSVKQYPKALKKVEDALAAADAGLKARQPNWPRFVVAVAIEILKTAPDEYEDAVVNGRIVHPIGYQTARGFIFQADRMVESVAGELEPNNAAALSDIRAGFAQLKQAFATVAAPKRPPMDNAALLDIVARIELAVGKLM
jgi:hypothetical protein